MASATWRPGTKNKACLPRGAWCRPWASPGGARFRLKPSPDGSCRQLQPNPCGWYFLSWPSLREEESRPQPSLCRACHRQRKKASFRPESPWKPAHSCLEKDIPDDITLGIARSTSRSHCNQEGKAPELQKPLQLRKLLAPILLQLFLCIKSRKWINSKRSQHEKTLRTSRKIIQNNLMLPKSRKQLQLHLILL
ncbi:hypothetical protein TURU_000628 [Turdus rufiventris]|nr:hypothetical protein TURU_000628 [Turdus rufiventris]